jgi:uncharacterized integral membrane protein (TIGR00698 family)
LPGQVGLHRLHISAPGVVISFTIGFAAIFLSEHYGAPGILFALLLGMSLNFLAEEPRLAPGITFAGSQVLRIGVALLGFQVAVEDLFNLGASPVIFIAICTLLTIAFGIVAARICGLKGRFGLVSGGSVAICGASAAVAISSVLPQDKDNHADCALVVIGVTTLSTVVMIVYPLLSTALALPDAAAGFFFGATIHDVAQVVGAGYSVSETSGEHAVLIKMIRILLLVPVVLAISFVYTRTPGEGKRAALVPGFLVAFIGFMFLGNITTVPAEWLDATNRFSQYCIVAAIAAIGMKTELPRLIELGWKPVALIVFESLFLAGMCLTYLLLYR